MGSNRICAREKPAGPSLSDKNTVRISTDLSVFAVVLVISISIRGFVSMNLIAKGVLLLFVIKSLLSAVTLLPFCQFKLSTIQAGFHYVRAVTHINNVGD